MKNLKNRKSKNGDKRGSAGLGGAPALGLTGFSGLTGFIGLLGISILRGWGHFEKPNPVFQKTEPYNNKTGLITTVTQ